MRILALLDPNAQRRLSQAIAPQFSARAVDVATVERELQGGEGALLVVVDPSVLRPAAFDVLITSARARPNVKVLVHAELTPANARAVIRASRQLPVEAVFFGATSEQDALGQVCGALLVPSVSALVLGGLASALTSMPDPLLTRVVGLFGGNRIPRLTSGMLDGLGVSIETAREWTAKAGIAHPHRLREAALIARAFPMLGRRAWRLEQVVARVDDGSVRSFERMCHALTGLSPRAAGRLEGSEMAQRLVAAMLSLRG